MHGAGRTKERGFCDQGSHSVAGLGLDRVTPDVTPAFKSARRLSPPDFPKYACNHRMVGEEGLRTFEVIRRLIYSQLPLPLGTLPRPNSIGTHPLNGGGRAMDDINTVSRWRAPGRARLWAKRHGKVNQRGPSKCRAAKAQSKLPESGTRDTSLS